MDSRYEKAREVLPKELFSDQWVRDWLERGGDPYDDDKVRILIDVISKIQSFQPYTISAEDLEAIQKHTDRPAWWVLAAYAAGKSRRSEVDAALLDAAKAQFPDDPLTCYAWLKHGDRFLTDAAAISRLRALMPDGAIPDLMDGMRLIHEGRLDEGLRMFRSATEKPLNDPASQAYIAETEFLMEVKGWNLRRAFHASYRVDKLEAGTMIWDAVTALDSEIAKVSGPESVERRAELAAYKLALRELQGQSDLLKEQRYSASQQVNLIKDVGSEDRGSPFLEDWTRAEQEIQEQYSQIKELYQQRDDFIDSAPDDELQAYWEMRKRMGEREALDAIIAARNAE